MGRWRAVLQWKPKGRERAKAAVPEIVVGIVLIFVGSEAIGALGLLLCLAGGIEILRGWSEHRRMRDIGST